MMSIKHDYFRIDLNIRNHTAHKQAICVLKEIFHKHGQELKRVYDLAARIKGEIEKISPFIQQNTKIVCPVCKEVCCIKKHGYYNYEDLIYLHALGLAPPAFTFGGNDSDPCQFLSHKGCTLDRSIRPSGCNWYFCEPLLDYMEKQPDYQEFDMAMTNLAELWLKLLEEFSLLTNPSHSNSDYS